MLHLYKGIACLICCSLNDRDKTENGQFLLSSSQQQLQQFSSLDLFRVQGHPIKGGGDEGQGGQSPMGILSSPAVLKGKGGRIPSSFGIPKFAGEGGRCSGLKQLSAPRGCALQRKSHLCVPFLGIARPQSPFMCRLWAIYILPGSVHILPAAE